MSTAIYPSLLPPSPGVPVLVTVGDLLDHLPDIPASRIRLQPAPGTATEEDVIRIRNTERALCELFDGVLVEKPMGTRESAIAGRALTEFNIAIRTTRSGIALGADGMLRLGERQVRMPDACFISWDRLPGRRFPTSAVWAVSPDIAVEVLSPSNSTTEIERKIGEYFESGTRLVWIADPPTKTVAVYDSPENFRTLSVGEFLDTGDILPGVRISIEELFQESA